MEDRELPADRPGGAAPEVIGLQAMFASLGSLLFLWSSVERALRDEIVAKRGSLPKNAHGILAAMRCWRTAISENEENTGLRPLLIEAFFNKLHQALIVRNRLCHGLLSIGSGDGESAWLGWELDNKQGRICWAELHQMFAWLSRVWRVLPLLSRTLTNRSSIRNLDTLENRQWWASEFGLHL